MKLNTASAYIFRSFFVALAGLAPLRILMHGSGPDPTQPFDWPRLMAWVCCLAGMLGMFVMVGLRIRDRALGVLIDERNRYSLSRLQMSLWTMLVLSTLYVVYLSNIVRADPMTAMSVNLDYNLVALMGFSIASFVTAPMALSRKLEESGSSGELEQTSHDLKEKQSLDSLPSAFGRVLVKQTPKDARLADLIRGEDIANGSVVDLPRLQMLLITVVVVCTYGTAVGSTLVVSPWVVTQLPTLNETLTLLVLVSHAGYIGGKLIPSGGSSASVQDSGRTLQAGLRASALVNELRAQLGASVVGDQRHAWLQRGLGLAQALASQAAALPAKAGTAAFKADDIARVEGQLDALEASLYTQPDAPAPRQVLDAPAPETVSTVQRRLYNLGHINLRITGVVDAETDQAIVSQLAEMKIARGDLHPLPYRYFEEVAQLI